MDFQPFKTIKDPERDLLAGIFLQARLDLMGRVQIWREDARYFLKSPEAKELIKWIDIEPNCYEEWVRRITE